MKNKILSLAKTPWKMKLYFFTKLPMALLAGLKVIYSDKDRVSVSVPYKFLNRNPFQSMYFAVMAMAAELPSGILALAAVRGSDFPVSTLVLDMRASFTKKAKTKVVFTCKDGKKIFDAVQHSIDSCEPQTVDIKSVGVDTDGDIVAEFNFTWTFKKK